MNRFVLFVVLLAAIITAATGVLSHADADTRYYTGSAAVLLAIVVLVVLVSALFAFVYLMLLGVYGAGFIQNRFPLFVGWNLLRSHRVRRTFGTWLRHQWRSLRTALRPRRVVTLLLGLGLVGAGLLVGDLLVWNAISAELSPAFARTLQISLFVVGGLVALYSLPSALAYRRPWQTADHTRARTAVTLPTFISIIGVSVGVWALIVVLSVMHGFASDLRSKILRTNAHIVIEPKAASGILGEALLLEDAVRARANVAEAHAFAEGEVMMSSSTNIAVNVVVKGLGDDALRDSAQLEGFVGPGSVEWLIRPEALVSDRYRYPIGPGGFDLDPFGPSRRPDVRERIVEVMPGILLGSELASSLHVDVGSEIQVISPDGDVGPTGLRPKLKSFRVAGIFTTGMYEYDQKLAYMTLDEAQRFFNLGPDMNRLEVRLAQADRTAEVLASVRALLGRDFPDLRATEWQERNRSLFSALQLERIAMFIVLGFIILVASLLIVSSLVMIIVEKAKEIAVLKALGASNRAIVTTFLVIGGVIGVIGTVSGVTLGVGTCLIIQKVGIPLPKEYYIPNIPVELDPLEVTTVALAAFAICLLATVYPSFAASRMRPVEGLRHG